MTIRSFERRRAVARDGPDFEVVRTCSTAGEGFRAVNEDHPDVMVLDLMLPGEDGLSLLRRLDSTKPPAVIVLTAVQDEDLLLDAARLGARGIVLKAMAPRTLEDCIRAVYRGERRLHVEGVDYAKRVEERQSVEAELSGQLTPR
jgi:DNA-binding NarL/FixJ family response regulator